MAYANVTGLWIPRLYPGTPTIEASTFTLDASGEMAGFILTMPKTGTIHKVGFRTGAVVQDQTIRVSFQTVAPTTGVPDETIDQFRNISILGTNDNVAKETGILSSDGTDGGTKRSVTIGEAVAIVFDHNPFNAGDIFRVASMDVPTPTNWDHLNYGALKTGGTWAKQTRTAALAIIYDDGACYWLPASIPVIASTGMNFNSGSSPPKRGLKFRKAVPFKSTGCVINMASAAGLAPNVVLYDTDGQTPLVTVALDTDLQRLAATDSWWIARWEPQTHLANTYYWTMLEPQSATNVTLYYMDVASAAYLDQMDGGQSFHYGERSGGAPTDTTTRRPNISVMISALDDGAGAGGGMLVHPGMAGRMAA
jgi:hypothetical protein